VKPKLLIIELWGVGDLAIATPFLREACEKFDVTLLAKTFARDLQARFWPAVKVIPFHAPWTAFDRKYHLHHWPWRSLFSVARKLRHEQFDVALSARRGDPRDHLLLRLSGAKMRLGYPRLGSRIFLTHPLASPDRKEYRYEDWRIAARALDFELEPRDKLRFPPRPTSRLVLLHTGAAQAVRVWPLERYLLLARKLRALGYPVRIVCDPGQAAWWKNAGEQEVAAPQSMSQLLKVLDDAGVFVGNDSGPGHLAASFGVPTFTLFGPQLPELFLPVHPAAQFLPGKPCPYKPCSDYCRFPVAHCLVDVTEAEVWPRVEAFVRAQLPPPATGSPRAESSPS